MPIEAWNPLRLKPCPMGCGIVRRPESGRAPADDCQRTGRLPIPLDPQVEKPQASGGTLARPDWESHRRLRHDRGRGPSDGVPVRWQGFLHHAGDAAVSAAQGTGLLRAAGGEFGPEAAGLSRTIITRLSDRPRRSLPHHRAGHLQRGDPDHPRGKDHVRPVFTAQERHPLRLRRRARLYQDRTWAPPGRHRRNALPEHVSRRASR